MPVVDTRRVIVYDREIDALARSEDMEREMHRMGRIAEREAKRLCPVSQFGHEGPPSPDPNPHVEKPPGHLRDSIHYEVGEDGHGVYMALIAGDDDDDTAEVMAVEFGSRPHTIESTGDWPLRNKFTGQVFGPVVHHPGTAAQPFLQPGMEAALRG